MLDSHAVRAVCINRGGDAIPKQKLFFKECKILTYCIGGSLAPLCRNKKIGGFRELERQIKVENCVQNSLEEGY